MKFPGSKQIIGWLSFASLGLGLFLGCRQEPPTAVEITTSTPVPATTGVAAADPTIAVLLTNQPATPTPVPPTPATTPTGDTCPPPAGWLPYTVRSQDTLFSLSQLTGTAVDEIKSANCLLDDFLAIGQILYLPVLPPPPAAVAALPAAPAAPTPCPSLLNCTFDPNVNLVRRIEGPGAAYPCQFDLGGPYLDATNAGEAFIGERIYFFACDFSTPQTWSVRLEVADGREADLVRDPYLTQDIQDLLAEAAGVGVDPPQLILAWDVTCDIPTGDFTLDITANNDPANSASLPSIVRIRNQSAEATPEPEILVSPPITTPGSLFEIHYCLFPPDQPITASLYYDSGQTDADGEPIYYFASDQQIAINSQGYGISTIQSHPDDPIRNYLIKSEYFEGRQKKETSYVFTLTEVSGGE